jgi:hypothetical protein
VNEFAKAGAVHVGHAAQIEHDFLVALLNQAMHLVFQADISAQFDVALHRHHRHVADDLFFELHLASWPSFRQLRILPAFPRFSIEPAIMGTLALRVHL